MLYPLKFTPILKERIWGGNVLAKQYGKTDDIQTKFGESWEISDLDENISMVTNGFLAENDLRELIETYMGELVGDTVFEKNGLGFPLLIKIIDAQDDLSVQVHPDDTLAQQRYEQNGKTEIWYIVHAEEDAGIYVGFNKPVEKQEYVDAVQNNEVASLLQFYPVKKGDLFFIPAGTVHALGKGVGIIEVQQPSDITYRIFDWNRVEVSGLPRTLHVAEALDAIHFNEKEVYKIEYEEKFNATSTLFRSEFFNINTVTFDKPLQKNYSTIDSFVVYICVEGEVHLFGNNFHEVLLAGETTLIPAAIPEINLVPNSKSQLLEIYV
ncbi:MAG: class I mannose-6-phosphate isomerase [Bacteroidetes bacterium]|nr:class I mannose-6-phosphate isomerase [Bacteroidota bacterium]MCL2302214.1 class I mannose-6-phosphate isomerase [Lentimicrobiaceae bacterium]MCL2302294.1 class I mannose-6-phosphate isomerase [Lentimicrobiaceae bacterium]